MAWVEVEFTNADLWDNGYDGTGNPQQSPFAFLRITTDSTTLRITGNSTSYPDRPELGIYVDGEFSSRCLFSALGSQAFEVDVGSGAKTVDIVTGWQTGSAGSIEGTFIDTVEYDNAGGATASIVVPSVEDLIVVLGDSIAVGGNSAVSVRDAWPMICKYKYGHRMLVEASSGRKLWTYAATEELRTALVAQIAAWAPEKIWIALGINDFFATVPTAAQFSAAYGSLLDALNAALPSAWLHAQSPLYYNPDTSEGETLQEFRDALRAECATRSAFSTYHDGGGMLSSQDTDGTHPTTAGHTTLATVIDSAIRPYNQQNLAYDMDGATHYATAPQAIAEAIVDEGAVAMWVRPDFAPSGTTQRRLFAIQVGGDAILLQKTTTTNQMQIRNNSRVKNLTVAGLWTAGSWAHFIAQWNKATATLQVFINGAEVTATASGTWGAEPVSSVIGIGASYDGSSKLDGAIGRVCIWDRLLTASEIAALQCQLPLYAAPKDRIAEWVPGSSAHSLVDSDDVLTLVGSPLTVTGPAYLWPTYVVNAKDIWNVPSAPDGWTVPHACDDWTVPG